MGLADSGRSLSAPQSEAIYVRPSSGHVIVNPINAFTHDFDGTNWTTIPGAADQMSQRP